MTQTKTLLEVTYHTDDETGIHEIGEVDFGIYGTLDEYLKIYGKKGKEDLINTLRFLIKYVENKLKFPITPAPQVKLKEA